MSLEEEDQAAAAVATHPRVTLDHMKSKVTSIHYVNGASLLTDDHSADEEGEREALSLLTICILVTVSGFMLVGKSAPASPENFNQELGEKIAYEDALRQLWPLEGYLLRDFLSKTS